MGLAGVTCFNTAEQEGPSEKKGTKIREKGENNAGVQRRDKMMTGGSERKSRRGSAEARVKTWESW